MKNEEAKISLARMYYPVKVLGPGNRVGIWLTGCDRRCPGCISPELQAYNYSKEVAVSSVMDMLKRIQSKIDGFTISGGEPFLQIKELKKLVEIFYERKKIKDILIFSGYTKEELEALNSNDIKYILSHIAVLVDGPYMEALHTELPLQGSSNQRVLILNKEFEQSYKDYMSQEKKFDVEIRNNEEYVIGIPMKDFKNKYKHI